MGSSWHEYNWASEGFLSFSLHVVLVAWIELLNTGCCIQELQQFHSKWNSTSNHSSRKQSFNYLWVTIITYMQRSWMTFLPPVKRHFRKAGITSLILQAGIPRHRGGFWLIGDSNDEPRQSPKLRSDPQPHHQTSALQPETGVTQLGYAPHPITNFTGLGGKTYHLCLQNVNDE